MLRSASSLAHARTSVCCHTCCRRWYPDALRNQPRPQNNHSAQEDIEASISQLRYWLSAIFRPLDTPLGLCLANNASQQSYQQPPALEAPQQPVSVQHAAVQADAQELPKPVQDAAVQMDSQELPKPVQDASTPVAMPQPIQTCTASRPSTEAGLGMVNGTAAAAAAAAAETVPAGPSTTAVSGCVAAAAPTAPATVCALGAITSAAVSSLSAAAPSMVHPLPNTPAPQGEHGDHVLHGTSGHSKIQETPTPGSTAQCDFGEGFTNDMALSSSELFVLYEQPHKHRHEEWLGVATSSAVLGTGQTHAQQDAMDGPERIQPQPLAANQAASAGTDATAHVPSPDDSVASVADSCSQTAPLVSCSENKAKASSASAAYRTDTGYAAYPGLGDSKSHLAGMSSAPEVIEDVQQQHQQPYELQYATSTLYSNSSSVAVDAGAGSMLPEAVGLQQAVSSRLQPATASATTYQTTTDAATALKPEPALPSPQQAAGGQLQSSLLPAALLDQPQAVHTTAISNGPLVGLAAAEGVLQEQQSYTSSQHAAPQQPRHNHQHQKGLQLQEASGTRQHAAAAAKSHQGSHSVSAAGVPAPADEDGMSAMVGRPLQPWVPDTAADENMQLSLDDDAGHASNWDQFAVNTTKFGVVLPEFDVTAYTVKLDKDKSRITEADAELIARNILRAPIHDDSGCDDVEGVKDHAAACGDDRTTEQQNGDHNQLQVKSTHIGEGRSSMTGYCNQSAETPSGTGIDTIHLSSESHDVPARRWRPSRPPVHDVPDNSNLSSRSHDASAGQPVVQDSMLSGSAAPPPAPPATVAARPVSRGRSRPISFRPSAGLGERLAQRKQRTMSEDGGSVKSEMSGSRVIATDLHPDAARGSAGQAAMQDSHDEHASARPEGQPNKHPLCNTVQHGSQLHDNIRNDDDGRQPHRVEQHIRGNRRLRSASVTRPSQPTKKLEPHHDFGTEEEIGPKHRTESSVVHQSMGSTTNMRPSELQPLPPPPLSPPPPPPPPELPATLPSPSSTVSSSSGVRSRPSYRQEDAIALHPPPPPPPPPSAHKIQTAPTAARSSSYGDQDRRVSRQPSDQTDVTQPPPPPPPPVPSTHAVGRGSAYAWKLSNANSSQQSLDESDGGFVMVEHESCTSSPDDQPGNRNRTDKRPQLHQVHTAAPHSYMQPIGSRRSTPQTTAQGPVLETTNSPPNYADKHYGSDMVRSPQSCVGRQYHDDMGRRYDDKDGNQPCHNANDQFPSHVRYRHCNTSQPNAGHQAGNAGYLDDEGSHYDDAGLQRHADQHYGGTGHDYDDAFAHYQHSHGSRRSSGQQMAGQREVRGPLLQTHKHATKYVEKHAAVSLVVNVPFEVQQCCDDTPQRLCDDVCTMHHSCCSHFNHLVMVHKAPCWSTINTCS